MPAFFVDFPMSFFPTPVTSLPVVSFLPEWPAPFFTEWFELTWSYREKDMYTITKHDLEY